MLDETTKRMFNTDAALEEAWAEIERLRRELDAAQKVIEAARYGSPFVLAQALADYEKEQNDDL